jgi:predicted transcriptional regulator
MNAQGQNSDTAGELEPSEIHNVLRNDRRRHAIDHLRGVEEPISVDELAEHIASLETGASPPPRDVRKSVYVSLHQTHLPKLDELGIVDYDQRDQRIELRDRAEEVEVYMEIAPEEGVSWSTYYLGVSVLGALTLLAVEFDVAFGSSFDADFWSWYFLSLIGLSAAYHAYAERTHRVFGS